MDIRKERQELHAYVKQLKATTLPCTFVKHGRTSLEQDLYSCKTCHLEGIKRVCKACFELCHKGHQAVYSPAPQIDDTTETEGGVPWSTQKQYVMEDGDEYEETNLQETLDEIPSEEQEILKKLIADQKK